MTKVLTTADNKLNKCEPHRRNDQFSRDKHEHEYDVMLQELKRLVGNSNRPWSTHDTIFSSLLALDALRKPRLPASSSSPSSPNNTQRLERLTEWLETNGVSSLATHHLKLQASSHLDHNNSLVSIEGLEADSSFLTIPVSLMLRADQPLPPSYDFLASDPLLASLPSLRLALVVLVERYAQDSSHWAPYLDSLPAAYSHLPLFYTHETFQALVGTDAFTPAVALVFHSVKQYLYLVTRYGRDGSTAAGTIFQDRTWFTLDRFLWAVATCVSRQNEIPIAMPSSPAEAHTSVLALVPCWDMLNHAAGPMTTTVDCEASVLSTVTATSVAAGEEIFMCYGTRSNVSFLLYSGFVPKDNPYHRTLALVIDPAWSLDTFLRDDPLAKAKLLLLNQHKLSSVLEGGGGGLVVHLAREEGTIRCHRRKALQIICMSKDEVAWTFRNPTVVEVGEVTRASVEDKLTSAITRRHGLLAIALGKARDIDSMASVSIVRLIRMEQALLKAFDVTSSDE